jgi:uncharacterized protein (UPF0332 family)
MSTAKDLSNYRMEQAEECLHMAKVSYKEGKYRTGANRTYYCILHSMRSLLALERKDFKKHTAVINCFRQKYIKSKVFEPEMSDMIKFAFSKRTDSDYTDFITISEDDIVKLIKNAEYFMGKVKEYLHKLEQIPLMLSSWEK